MSPQEQVPSSPPTAAPAPQPKPTQPPATPLWSRLAIPLFAVIVALGFVALATQRFDEWVGNAVVQTTNDAYVRAELTRLASRVSGEVLTVAVTDFQRVKAGDLLIQIDPADYQAQVAQSEASGRRRASRARQSGQPDRAAICDDRAGASCAALGRSHGGRGAAGAGAPAIAVADRIRHAAAVRAGSRRLRQGAGRCAREPRRDRGPAVTSSKSCKAPGSSAPPIVEATQGDAGEGEAQARLHQDHRRRSTASSASGRSSPATTSTSAPTSSTSCRCRRSM